MPNNKIRENFIQPLSRLITPEIETKLREGKAYPGTTYDKDLNIERRVIIDAETNEILFYSDDKAVQESRKRERKEFRLPEHEAQVPVLPSDPMVRDHIIEDRILRNPARGEGPGEKGN